MATFNNTFDADGSIDAAVADSDADVAFFDDCNDAADGLSADYIYLDSSVSITGEAWLRLEDVPADFNSLSALSMDVDVMSAFFVTETGTLTAQIFDSDSGGSENPLTDEQTIATEADSTRTQRTVNFGSLTGSKTQWNAAYCLLSWDISGGVDGGEVRLYGAEVDGVYGSGSPPALVAPRVYFSTTARARSRSHYRGGVMDKALTFSAVVKISEEQTLLFGADPVIEGGSLASGRWRR